MGLADVVVTTRVPPGFLGEYLFDVTFVAVARPDHPLFQVEHALTTADLAHHAQVVVRDSGVKHPRDEGWLGAERRYTVSSVEVSLATIEAGLAYAWLPEHVVGEALRTRNASSATARSGRLAQGHAVSRAGPAGARGSGGARRDRVLSAPRAEHARCVPRPVLVPTTALRSSSFGIPEPCVGLPDHVLESRVAANCVHVRIGLDPVQCFRADSCYVGPEHLERRVVVAEAVICAQATL